MTLYVQFFPLGSSGRSRITEFGLYNGAVFLLIGSRNLCRPAVSCPPLGMACGDVVFSRIQGNLIGKGISDRILTVIAGRMQAMALCISLPSVVV